MGDPDDCPPNASKTEADSEEDEDEPSEQRLQTQRAAHGETRRTSPLPRATMSARASLVSKTLFESRPLSPPWRRKFRSVKLCVARCP